MNSSCKKDDNFFFAKDPDQLSGWAGLLQKRQSIMKTFFANDLDQLSGWAGLLQRGRSGGRIFLAVLGKKEDDNCLVNRWFQ